MTCKDCKDYGRGECADACADGFTCFAFKPETDAPASTPTAAPTAAHDNVNHPAHYQGKHECIEEMLALFGAEDVKAFCRCNVFKYRFRAAEKNGAEDIAKAEWYMEYLMKLEEET